ncbi:hypothetical protein HDC92_001395 [Pedobacter sp. AK017]|uniref:hypothetical protein n=1 Tax=Pedobacter sp. AK017 TaxID=2723073 RepID=UPI0016181597|nr:hypothetical protein [Pedobacter sp. AK017]MBB5437721.1 hypothetical protein [Pedobacter sp. AK017]
MDNIKKTLIDQCILSHFVNPKESLIDRVYAACRLHNTIKGQELEVPGEFNEGRMWLPVSSMVHSFVKDTATNNTWGTRIWKKKQFIFFTPCLLEKKGRTDYIGMIEGGTVLSIGYPELEDLMISYAEVDKWIKYLSSKNEQYYQERAQLLHKEPIDRVAQFIKENPAFVGCTSQAVQASHVRLKRGGYINQLKKIKERNLIGQS